MELLLEILKMKRPHRGVNENKLAMNILSRLDTDLLVYKNATGDPMAYIMTTDPSSRTLFTAHLDTVHKEELTENPVMFDKEMEWMCKGDNTPLGADDGSGVWLLYKMIEANIPGTFLFTLGEEKGGVGAKFVSQNATKDFEGKFDRAIAFDRRGYTDVITHQGFGGRCCSDEFALHLAKALNEACPDKIYPGYAPDDGGVYTDTADFIGLVGECTNISCGYDHEHTNKETQDVAFLKELLTACLTIDWAGLPVVRKPGEVDHYSANSYDYNGWGGNVLGDPLLPPSRRSEGMLELDEKWAMQDLKKTSLNEIYNRAYNDPEWVIDILLSIRGVPPNDPGVGETESGMGESEVEFEPDTWGETVSPLSLAEKQDRDAQIREMGIPSRTTDDTYVPEDQGSGLRGGN